MLHSLSSQSALIQVNIFSWMSPPIEDRAIPALNHGAVAVIFKITTGILSLCLLMELPGHPNQDSGYGAMPVQTMMLYISMIFI